MIITVVKTNTKNIIWIVAALLAVLSVAVISLKFNCKALDSKAAAVVENVHSIILMDESGSMMALRKTAIEGAEEVIKSVHAASDTIANVNQFLTLAFFDGNHGSLRLDYMVNNQAICDVDADLSKYSPEGATPLYDAIGETIVNHLGKVGPNDHVLMSIITDGYENYSRKYQASDIKRLVDSLSRKNWSFTYVGANQDAILEGGKMGIKDAYNYDNTQSGYKEMIGRDIRRRNGAISRIATERGRQQSVQK